MWGERQSTFRTPRWERRVPMRKSSGLLTLYHKSGRQMHVWAVDTAMLLKHETRDVSTSTVWDGMWWC